MQTVIDAPTGRATQDLALLFVEYSEKHLKQIDSQLLAAIASEEDSPEGFKAFYELLSPVPLPDHLYKMVEGAYDSHKRDKGALFFSFRGSWKTTTITILFTAFRIGKEPYRANLIVQANDDSAIKSAAAIAMIIDNHPAWKMVFPHVVPDKPNGWGANGYQVRDNSISDDEWARMNALRKDPSLLGVGYKSSSAIGKHPDGVFIIDDIHDEKNTKSDKEIRNVVTVVTDTLLPMVVEDETKSPGQRLITWEIAVGTPWHEKDAYHHLKSTGEFDFLMFPVMRRCEEEDAGATRFDHEDLVGWYSLTWPDRFSERIIKSWRNKSGKRGFARMYLLDLKAAQETGLKYQLYPSEEIDLRWPAGGGVDYASTIEIRGRDMEPKDRSKFAIAYGMKLPVGGAVIQGGFSDHVTQLQAEGHVEKAQGIFKNWITCGIEMDGVGAELYSLLSRKPWLRLFPFWTKGQSKPNRHERILSPWLEMGMVKISDADTPYLNDLRKALDDWPNGSFDEIDAVFAYCQTIPDVLQIIDLGSSEDPERFGNRRKQQNPFAAFGNRSVGI